MPAPTQNDPDDEPRQPTSSRCVEIELENGALVIYDTENHSAWIQSDDAVDVTALA
jgi:hypothetical protein